MAAKALFLIGLTATLYLAFGHPEWLANSPMLLALPLVFVIVGAFAIGTAFSRKS